MNIDADLAGTEGETYLIIFTFFIGAKKKLKVLDFKATNLPTPSNK